MRVKLAALFKFYVVSLVVLMVWCLWANAAESDAPVTAPATNTTSALSSTNAAAMHFGLKNIDALQRDVFGVPLWQYLASLIYIVLAFAIARFLDWLIRSKLRHWVAKTKTRLDDILIQLLGGPIKIIVFVVLLHVGLRLFPWPEVVERYVSNCLLVIIAISMTYVALRMIDVLVDYWRQRAAGNQDAGLSDHLLPFIRNIAKAFFVIVAVLLTCETLGLPMKGLLASLSVGGLALGLAAQDTLANLFGAVAVFVDKPFRVGDRIKLDAVEGAVEIIGMRSTRVRTADGHLVTIPNKTVGNATITNITKRSSIRTVMNIGVTYSTSTEQMKQAVQILEEIFQGHPMTKDVLITFNRFDSSALNIEVVHFWNATDYKAYLRDLQQMNLRVKERFDGEGIEFAFPTQTVYVKSLEAA